METNPLVQRLLRIALVRRTHPNVVYRTLGTDKFMANVHLSPTEFNNVMWTYMLEYHAQELEGYDLIG